MRLVAAARRQEEGWVVGYVEELLESRLVCEGYEKGARGNCLGSGIGCRSMCTGDGKSWPMIGMGV